MFTKFVRNGSLLGLVALAAWSLTGCGSSSPDLGRVDVTSTETDAAVDALRGQLADQEAALSRAQEEARAARAEAERLRAEGSSMTAGGTEPLLPADAKVGDCFARVLVPPVYETAKQEVLVKEAADTISLSKGDYGWGEKTVVVKEASESLKVIPAEYEWVEEKVMVKPPRKKLQVVPATWGKETEKVLVEPARTYWKKGRGLIEQVDNLTGEIMCLVEEPARYQTITKTVLKTPEGVKEIEIPAEYKTVKKMVVKKAATTQRVEIPAKTQTIKVMTEGTPPSPKKTAVPAKYKSVTTRKMVTASKMEMRRVYCETNMTRAMVSELQTALKAAKFDPGPIDGIYGPLTKSALIKYQKSKNLASGGLTYATLRSLGIAAK